MRNSPRVVVGALGAGDTVGVARRLRDEGREVVLAGERRTAEQLVRTAFAEDAAEVVLVGSDADVEAVRSALAKAGADDLLVTRADRA